MQTAIKHNWLYAAPPQTVWEFLTQPELLSQWLMPNNILPVVGHQFTFKVNPMPALEFDGNVYCEILEVIPHKKLVYSWKSGAGDGRLNLDSVVTWTLHEKENGTALFLEHTGFDEQTNAALFQAMDKGWKKNISELLAKLITKPQTGEAVRS